MNVAQLTSRSVSKQNFTGKIPKQFTEVISKTNVSKNLTELDRYCFKRYIDAIPYRTGVNQAEIKSLEKLNGQEFVSACKDMILTKMGIPEKVRPNIYLVEQIAGDAEMMYVPNNNIILCDNSKVQSSSKSEVFGLIRHECQHFAQNSSVLRHETVGDSAIDKMVKTYINQQKTSCKALWENCSEEQLQQMFAEVPETLTFINKAKELYSKGDTKAYEELFTSYGEEYKEQLLQFQALLKDSMGSISKDNPLTQKIAKYGDELFNIDYFNGNSEINYDKYVSKSIEQEAMNAQIAGLTEFDTKTCPVKNIKNFLEEFFKDEELQNKLNAN